MRQNLTPSFLSASSHAPPPCRRQLYQQHTVISVTNADCWWCLYRIATLRHTLQVSISHRLPSVPAAWDVTTGEGRPHAAATDWTLSCYIDTLPHIHRASNTGISGYRCKYGATGDIDTGIALCNTGIGNSVGQQCSLSSLRPSVWALQVAFHAACRPQCWDAGCNFMETAASPECCLPGSHTSCPQEAAGTASIISYQAYSLSVTVVIDDRSDFGDAKTVCLFHFHIIIIIIIIIIKDALKSWSLQLSLGEGELWVELGLLPIPCRSHSVHYNTGINTGIPVLISLNTEVPVLPNVIGTGGPTYTYTRFYAIIYSFSSHVKNSSINLTEAAI